MISTSAIVEDDISVAGHGVAERFGNCRNTHHSAINVVTVDRSHESPPLNFEIHDGGSKVRGNPEVQKGIFVYGNDDDKCYTGRSWLFRACPQIADGVGENPTSFKTKIILQSDESRDR